MRRSSITHLKLYHYLINPVFLKISSLFVEHEKIRFLLWFFLIFSLKYHVLIQPPVWDTAMGTFPPAIFLYNSGFDITALVSEPGWNDGGANVHSFSIVSWVTAIVMSITKKPESTFVVLHVLTFMTMAWALNHLFRIAQTMTDSVAIATAFCFSTLLCPIILVQTGYMYTEIPVFACSAAAIRYWFDGRRTRVVLWCGIAMFIKLTAIITVVAIATAIIFHRRFSKRFSYLAALATPVLLKFFLDWIAVQGGLTSSPGYYIAKPYTNLASRLLHVPDIALLLLIGSVVPIVWRSTLISGIRNNVSPVGDGFSPSGRSVVLLLTPLFVSGVLYQLSDLHVWFLPRYTVIIIPFALLSFSYSLLQISGKRLATIFLFLITLFFTLNYNGLFYPAQFTKFSIVERSHQYRHFQNVQKLGLRALARKPEEVQGYYCRDAGYMASDPMMGYLEDTIANTFPIYLEPYRSRSIEDFPDHFFLLRSNEFHGCQYIDRLTAEIKRIVDWKIKETDFSIKGYHVVLYELRRNSTDVTQKWSQ